VSRPVRALCLLTLATLGATGAAHAAVPGPARPAAAPEAPAGSDVMPRATLSGPLKGTPFAAFTPEDTRWFLAAAGGLVAAPNGTSRRWANDASGAWGSIEAVRSFRRSGNPCRELHGEHVASGGDERFRLVTCRTSRGEWRIVSSGPRPARTQRRAGQQ